MRVPQARAAWWDFFFEVVIRKVDSFFEEHDKEGAWRSVRRQVFGEEYDAAEGKAGPDRDVYIWARESASYQEVVEALATLGRLDMYASARRWGGAFHEEAMDAAAKLGPLDEYETARWWGHASHQEIMEAVAAGVDLPAYAAARCGTRQRPRRDSHDTRASHEEIMEIHALGFTTARKLRAYVTARAWASHAEVKEALAGGEATPAFLLAYARTRRQTDASHSDIMEALAKGGDLSVFASQQG